MKTALFTALAILLACAAMTPAVTAVAQEGDPSPEEAAMMAAFQASMTPGEQHAYLAGLAGDFTATVSSFEDPSGEPQVSRAELTRTLELGGRVLHETWTGTVMGMPFEGVGRTGYDNVTKRFWTTWTDNLSTGLFYAYGGWDEDGGALVFKGAMPDPISGEMIDTKSVSTAAEDGKEHTVMYRKAGDEWVKIMTFDIVPK